MIADALPDDGGRTVLRPLLTRDKRAQFDLCGCCQELAWKATHCPSAGTAPGNFDRRQRQPVDVHWGAVSAECARQPRPRARLGMAAFARPAPAHPVLPAAPALHPSGPPRPELRCAPGYPCATVHPPNGAHWGERSNRPRMTHCCCRARPSTRPCHLGPSCPPPPTELAG